MIILPSNPQPNGAEPRFVDMGGWQVPPFGGPATRVDRLGSRHGISVSLPPMRLHDEQRGIHGREWISKLKRGLQEGVRIAFPQPGFVPSVGASATATLSADRSSGDLDLALQGLPAGGVLEEGLFLSVQDAVGRYYLHSVNTETTADGGGLATVPIHPRLRADFVTGATVLIGTPVIEGRLSGNEFAWTIELVRTVGLQFDIEEIV